MSAYDRDTRLWYDDYWKGDSGPVGSARDSGGSVEADAVIYGPRGEIVLCSRRRRVGFMDGGTK